MLNAAPLLYTPVPVMADVATPIFAIAFFAVMAAMPRILLWLLHDPQK